jgi:hypothetical protein
MERETARMECADANDAQAVLELSNVKPQRREVKTPREGEGPDFAPLFLCV